MEKTGFKALDRLLVLNHKMELIENKELKKHAKNVEGLRRLRDLIPKKPSPRKTS